VVLACLTAAFSCAVWGQEMGFGGPAILSEDGAPLGRFSAALAMSIRPFGGVNARFDSSIASSDLTGTVIRNNFGMDGNWGLYGVHQRQRALFSVDYRGTYRQYSGASRRNGINHFGSMNFVTQVGPATDISAALGVSAFRYGLMGGQTSLIQNVLPDVGEPEDEVLDASTKSYRFSLGMRRRITQRFSIRLRGSGFETRRVRTLISSRGAGASLGISMRVAHNKSLGVSYSYGYHFFPNGYGQTQSHHLTLNYTQQLSPLWHLNVGLGAVRSENDRLRRVTLDPEIAALTGQSEALEAIHRITFRPVLRLTISRQFERSNLSLFYRRSVRPGNGFITSSMNESWGAAYGYTATERLHASLHFSGSSHSALAQEIGRFTQLGGGIGLSYRLFSIVHLTSRVDAHHWVVTQSNLNRNRLSAALGLTFSPGQYPLVLW
jgi:hypothetical protein